MERKIALITGGSRGLGRNAAVKLAQRGTDIIFTYQSRQADAEAAAAEIGLYGGKCAALQLDVGNSSSFPAFREQLKAELEKTWQRPSFDFLVNNAGSGVNAPFTETTEEQFDLMMNIHLKGPFFLTQALLPLIADGGRILNVSSGLARFTFPGLSAYAVMKGGVEVLTRYLAKELAERRIAVNTLAPGAIETDFGGGAVRDSRELNEAIAAQTALGRVGVPDDIGGVVAALLSEDCRWINAQRIEASGGIHI